MLEAFLGTAVGVLTIFLARVIRGQHWMFAIGLLTLPSLYAFSALRVGETAVSVLEMVYGIPFIGVGLVFAFASIRHSAVVVGAFWILHGLYDLVHSRLIANAGVPES